MQVRTFKWKRALSLSGLVCLECYAFLNHFRTTTTFTTTFLLRILATNSCISDSASFLSIKATRWLNLPIQPTSISWIDRREMHSRLTEEGIRRSCGLVQLGPTDEWFRKSFTSSTEDKITSWKIIPSHGMKQKDFYHG